MLDYLMDRQKEYPPTKEVLDSAEILLDKVNRLFKELLIVPKVTSGYRPGKFNSKAGGAKKSAHMTGEAVDLRDTSNEIKKRITLDHLIKYDLYMEHPAHTNGWVHLQTRKTRSGNRIFKP